MIELFPIAFFIVSIIFLIIATLTDLKERIVSDKLNYGMLAIGLIGHAIWAIVAFDAMIFVLCLAAIGISFVFSWLLWKAGVWAGGDVKLFLAISALNPVNYAVLGNAIFPNSFFFKGTGLPIFAITLFVYSLFSTLPYGIIVIAHRTMKSKEVRKEFFAALKKRAITGIEGAIAIVGIGAILSFFQINLLVEIPLLIVYGLIRKNKIRIPIAIICFVFALITNVWNSLQWFIYLIVILFCAFFMFQLYALSKKVMRKKIKISELEEGIIPAETIMEKDGEIFSSKDFEMKKIINYIKHNKLQELREYLKPKGKVIVSKASARGLEKQEIKELEKLEKNNKIGNSILVKESIPFVPAVLIAYIATSILGDLLWNWFLLL